MNITGKGVAWLVGGAVVSAYLYLCFLVAASPQPPAWAVLIGLMPMAALMLVQAWHVRWRWLALAGCVALFAGAFIGWELVRSHVAWVYLAQHVGAMGALGLMFGMTLTGRHADAFCSRIAAFVTPEPLDEAYLRYTWQVTLAWTVFFLLMLTASLLLFFWGPITWWSFLANLLTPVLTGTMFVVEYLVRIRVLPDRPHMSVAGTIQAYQRFRQGS